MTFAGQTPPTANDIAASIAASNLAANTAAAIVASALAGNTATAVAASALAQNTADKVVASTLASDTATQIVTTKNLGQDTANKIAVAGAPPIDALAQIVNLTQATVSTVKPANSGLVNVTKYQSIVCMFTDMATAAGGPISPPAARKIDLIWYSDSAGTIELSRETLYTSTSLNGLMSMAHFRTSVKGAYLKVSPFASTTIAATSQQLFVFGSYKTVQVAEHRFLSGNSNVTNQWVAAAAQGNGYDFWTSGRAAASNPIGPSFIFDYPHHSAGAATFHYYSAANAAGLQCVWFINDLASGEEVWRSDVLTPGNGNVVGNVNLNLSIRPVQIEFQYNTAGSYGIQRYSLTCNPA